MLALAMIKTLRTDSVICVVHSESVINIAIPYKKSKVQKQAYPSFVNIF